MCRQSCNPSKWIANSCVWYSQVITQKLGLEKLECYLKQFNYGNQDISGDKGKNNGLTQAWLSSSLQISVEEQVDFLEKFLNAQFPITSQAYEKTHTLLSIEDFTKSFTLYGKTGSGYCLNKDGSLNKDLQNGWFIGWLHKGDSKIIFAYYLEDEEKEDHSAGLRAKHIAKDKLVQLIEYELFDCNQNNILK